jgi:hypothetical protein
MALRRMALLILAAALAAVAAATQSPAVRVHLASGRHRHT